MVEKRKITVQIKQYRQRDALAKHSLELALAKRYQGDAGAEGDDGKTLEMMYLINNYPLLRYGIAEDGAEGIELPLTEDAFWDLPEEFVMETTEAIREVNPQYALPFTELQKALFSLSNLIDKTAPGATSPNETADSETSKDA